MHRRRKGLADVKKLTKTLDSNRKFCGTKPRLGSVANDNVKELEPVASDEVRQPRVDILW